MDITIHNIKTFVCLVSAPEQHTKHKTMRAPRIKRGQALYRTDKPPPGCPALGGLLNEYLMAVDFTHSREIDRRFLFICSHSRFAFFYADYRLIWLTAWQCYIAKYP
jgi:hypothetical protein